MQIKEETIAFTTVGFPVGNTCVPHLAEIFFLVGMRQNSYRGFLKSQKKLVRSFISRSAVNIYEVCSLIIFTFVQM